MIFLRLLAAASALILVSCAGTAATVSDVSEPSVVDTVPSATPEVTLDTTTTSIKVDDSVPRSPLADSVVQIGNAIYQPPDEEAPRPVSLSVPTLGVEEAPVVGVGVLDDGDMEIPAASDVGWYRFGPSPGQSGSAVLAAHVAFNGQPGVFRRLSRVEVGDLIEVGFDDGTTRQFQITGTEQYDKDELPAERIFAKTGAPEVALITCGGAFNRALRSYEDNIVAYAEPVD